MARSKSTTTTTTTKAEQAKAEQAEQAEQAATFDPWSATVEQAIVRANAVQREQDQADTDKLSADASRSYRIGETFLVYVILAADKAGEPRPKAETLHTITFGTVRKAVTALGLAEIPEQAKAAGQVWQGLAAASLSAHWDSYRFGIVPRWAEWVAARGVAETTKAVRESDPDSFAPSVAAARRWGRAKAEDRVAASGKITLGAPRSNRSGTSEQAGCDGFGDIESVPALRLTKATTPKAKADHAKLVSETKAKVEQAKAEQAKRDLVSIILDREQDGTALVASLMRPMVREMTEQEAREGAAFLLAWAEYRAEQAKQAKAEPKAEPKAEQVSNVTAMPKARRAVRVAKRAS